MLMHVIQHKYLSKYFMLSSYYNVVLNFIITFNAVQQLSPLNHNPSK